MLLQTGLFGIFSYEHFTLHRFILVLIALPGGIVAVRTLYKLYVYGGEKSREDS